MSRKKARWETSSRLADSIRTRIFMRSVLSVVWINRFVQTGQSRLHNVNWFSGTALGNAAPKLLPISVEFDCCGFAWSNWLAEPKLAATSPSSPKWASTRQPSLASRAKAGGADRDRTDDLMLAKHALSQLSYGPLSGSIKLGSSGGPGTS